ncbi:hypothetical protein ACMZOO_10245 [Catenovulum sp. SX2]|uniref:hypothetical protein n=1 Tax=Catenovulum sp. SX2 TaxID=3398614 RepID=UPI003F828FF2
MPKQVNGCVASKTSQNMDVLCERVMDGLEALSRVILHLPADFSAASPAGDANLIAL